MKLGGRHGLTQEKSTLYKYNIFILWECQEHMQCTLIIVFFLNASKIPAAFLTHKTLCLLFVCKTHQAQLVLPIFPQMCGLPVECGWYTRAHILKENWPSPSASIFELSIASYPGVGTYVSTYLPFLCWDFICCMHAVTTFVNSYVLLPSCVQSTVSCGPLPPLALIIFLAPLLR